MDNHSVKRSRSSGIVLKNANEERGQFCNRLGCKGRLNHTNLSQSGCSGKYKSPRSLPLNASNGMDVIGTTGTKSVVGGKTRKSVDKSHTSSRYFKSEKYSSETTITSVHEDERHVSDIAKVSVAKVGSSRVSLPNTSNNRKKVSEKKPGIGTQSTLFGSSGVNASKIGTNNQGTRRTAANASRYDLRNLRCNSISDVLPSGSSSFSSKHSKRKDLVKKINTEVESSSSSDRGKKMSGPLSEGRKFSIPNHGVSIPDSRRGRSVSGNNTRTGRRFPHSSSRMEFSTVTPRSESSSSMELSFTANEASSSTHSMPFTRPGSTGPRELGIPNALLNLEGFRRHNIDGIAEALLALERIEQDMELTNEQLMALDANLFLGGLGFFDQHREMRLDIDDMSYEELLALEEKMGSVSTALPEEVIFKSLRCGIFQPKALGEGNMIGLKEDQSDVKCSICQEEYKAEDEMGRLKCEHGYHMECIHQWLRHKNWCPICKAPAAPPA